MLFDFFCTFVFTKKNKKTSMKTDKIKNLDQLEKLTNLYFRTLKPSDKESETNIAEIKFLNYFEMGCAVTDLLRLCILALQQEAHKTSSTNKEAIDVSLILEMILQMIPLPEMEFLSEINYLLLEDSKNIKE